MDPDSLSKAFVEHYYSQFDSNRQALIALYHEGSMLSFEGDKVLGAQNISAKLNSLPFQQCKHNISSVDCQTSGPAGGMLVFVNGNLQLPGEEHLLKFSQLDDGSGPTLEEITSMSCRTVCKDYVEKIHAFGCWEVMKSLDQVNLEGPILNNSSLNIEMEQWATNYFLDAFK